MSVFSRPFGRMFSGAVLALGLGSSALAQDAVPVRFAYPTGMNGQIPVVVEKAGIAQKHGLAAEYNQFQNGPPMFEALASGNVDVVVSSYQPLTTYLLKQPGSVSVIANLGHSSYALVVPKDSDIASLGALKGKRIALSFGSDSHLDLLRAIKQQGLNPATDFTLINLQPSDLQLALAQGQTDAIVIRQPQVQKLVEQGAKVLQSWPHYYIVAARNDFLKQHPEAKKKLQATLRETVAFIANNGDQASAWFGEQLRLDPRIVRDLAGQNPIFKGVKKPADAKVDFDQDNVQRLNDWFNAAFDNGLVKTRPEPYKG